MSGSNDFNDFFEKVLIEIADRQIGEKVVPIEVGDVCKFVQTGAPPSWTSLTAEHLERHNYGSFKPDVRYPGKKWFLIGSSGVAYAARFRMAHTPPSFTDRLASDKFQKLGNLSISFLSFLVSIGALIVAFIALNKAN